MNLGFIPPPTGTIRSWLDMRANEEGATISHYFPDAPPLTWTELREGAVKIAEKSIRSRPKQRRERRLDNAQ